MQTIREEKRGELTLRMVKNKSDYSGVILSKTRVRLALIGGSEPTELWRKLEQEAARTNKDYIGFDGARARFLRLYPDGFATPQYATEERNYKVALKTLLNATAPLDKALTCSGLAEAVLAVYQKKPNLLSPFEIMRVKDLLRGPSADDFIRAATRFAAEEQSAQALVEMARLAKPCEAAKWTVITYLPFLWLPERHMFLKPEVTKDFATRVGHPFLHAYKPVLEMSVYESLLNLAGQTEREIADFHPRDRIDVQSFIWVVGDHPEKTAEK